MGVGPNTAVMGNIGWTNTESRQWKSVTSHWHRLRSMEQSRLNFKVVKRSYRYGNNRCRNW